MKKLFTLAAAAFASLAFSAAAVAGPLTTTVKTATGNKLVNVENALTIDFSGGAITVRGRGGVIKYYSDYAGSARYSLVNNAEFTKRYAQINANVWFNVTLPIETDCSGGTVVTFNDGQVETIADGCAAHNAARNNSLNP